jgi:hypothetical protein
MGETVAAALATQGEALAFTRQPRTL